MNRISVRDGIVMLRLHWHIFTTFSYIFCVDPTHTICVCKCTAHFSTSRVYTHFPSGKAGMSGFRHIRRDAEDAFTLWPFTLTNFLRSRKCAIKMFRCKRSITVKTYFRFIRRFRVITVHHVWTFFRYDAKEFGVVLRSIVVGRSNVD